MAAKIVPIALAIIGGVSVAVATFQPELEAQQKRRLEEEYRRDLAAAAAASGNSALAREIAPQFRDNTLREEIRPRAQAPQENERSKLSSLLGLWAWQKPGSDDTSTFRNSSGSSNGVDQSQR
ncbi:uncharacterized protein EI97DRAFT_432446 [Westerdykella ornata]|uniref:Uncharacterized protein n=1 Tax=Westerdykella ornata TaxID=318751 RepID=A0A6A6JLQ1_WESOR|nr:uncharacterized protein EI97DRAFT_432446 [Westerdykella ornata]KAF2277590.1 hypothetical protein EI97DRAFT_432446 [Westerdykella ornata]